MYKRQYFRYPDFEELFLKKENFSLNSYVGEEEVYEVSYNFIYKRFSFILKNEFIKNFIYPYEKSNDFGVYLNEDRFNRTLISLNYEIKNLELFVKKFFYSKELPFNLDFTAGMNYKVNLWDIFSFESFLNFVSERNVDENDKIPSYLNSGVRFLYNKKDVSISFAIENIFKERIYFQRYFGIESLSFKFEFGMKF